MTDVYTNRIIQARLRPVGSRRGTQEWIDIFRKVGWTPLKPAPGSDDLLVAIPLYCARAAALRVAQGKISRLSEQHGSLRFEELRLEKNQNDHRRIYSAYRRHDGWANRVTGKFALPPEFGLNHLHWIVGVGRSGEMSRDRIDAISAFGRSPLDGPPFDVIEHDVVSNMEPRKITVDPSRNPWRSIGLTVLVLLLILALIVTSAVTWRSELGWEARAGSAAFSLAISTFAGLWFTGDGRRRLVRLAAVLGVITAAMTMGWGYRAFEPNIPHFGLLLLAVGTIFFVVFGWTHVLPYHRSIALLGSIVTIAAIITTVSAMGDTIIEMWLSEFGIPAQQVLLPKWAGASTAGVVLVVGVVPASLLGAIFGYLEYFGFLGYDRSSRTIGYFLAFGCFAIYGLSGFIGAMNIIDRVAESGIGQLQSDETPKYTQDFIYRACVSPTDASTDLVRHEGIDLTSPVTVVEGNTGQRWIVDVKTKSQDRSLWTRQVPASSLAISRVADHHTQCT